jgi:hypothetical protein
MGGGAGPANLPLRASKVEVSQFKPTTENGVGTKKTGKGRRKIGRKKRRMRAKIRHRKG